MKATLSWDEAPEKSLGRWLRSLFKDFDKELQSLARKRAAEITEWMQENAVWEDDTGKARASLVAKVTKAQDMMIEIVMEYDDPEVYYSVYLEMMQAGRFSILTPALEHWGPIIMDDVRELVGQ